MKLTFIEGEDSKGQFVCKSWDYDISQLKDGDSPKYGSIEEVQAKKPEFRVWSVVLKDYLTANDGAEIERLAMELDAEGFGRMNKQKFTAANSFAWITNWTLKDTPLSYEAFMAFRMERFYVVVTAIQEAIEERDTTRGDFL